MQYFRGERVAELRKEIIEKSRAGVPKEIIMAEYRLSESTYHEILRRYDGKTELNDFMDKPKKPKKPHRKLSEEDYRQIERLLLEHEERLEKKSEDWESKNEAAPRPVGPKNLERHKEKIKNFKKGTRRIACDFNREKRDEGQDKSVGKSHVHNILTRAGLTPKARQEAEEKETIGHLHRRSNPCTEMQMDTSRVMLVAGVVVFIAGIIDIFNSGILVAECAGSKSHKLVLRALRQLRRIIPEGHVGIKMDHGKEFEHWKVERYCRKHDIEIIWNEKGTPWQNGFIERWFQTAKKEYLNLEFLCKIGEVRKCLRKVVAHYNNERPHSSFNYRTPVEVLMD